MALDLNTIGQIIEEIQGEGEVTRRARMLRRQKIYRDGGREFLVEQILSEFGRDALKEMRLAPISLLKKIINKRSVLYKQPPIRLTEQDSDKDLMQFYINELSFNEKMMKAHRYFNLFSNTVLYLIPTHDLFDLRITPSTLYSISPDKRDPTKVDTHIFNDFIEKDRIIPLDDVPRMNQGGFTRQRGTKVANDLIDSDDRDFGTARKYIFWNDLQHFTTNDEGILFTDPSKDETQFLNPVGISPVINLAKDRDNEAWATQGDDMVDLAMAIQLGWSDLLTIAKHQGFSYLTVTSEDEPKTLNIGLNKVIWLKQRDGMQTPKIEFIQGNSPLSEYKDLLMDLLGLLLTTNDMNPNAIGGVTTSRVASSGFHALIEMADTIEATRQDEAPLRNTEKQFWKVLAAWHNWRFDEGILREDAKQLGKFSEGFSVSIIYPEIKPVENDQDKIAVVKDLLSLGLITQKDAIQRMQPDLTVDEVEAKLKEIEEQRNASAQRMISMSTEDETDQS